MADINLEEKNIYTDEIDVVSSMINELVDPISLIKGSSKSLEVVQKDIARCTNIIYNLITSMLITMLFNLLISPPTIKLTVYFILVIIHIYGLSVCKAAETLLRFKTKRHIREVKDTSSQLKKALEQKISQLTLQIPDKDSLPMHERVNNVIIISGIISRHDYPYIARLLISIFKNGALLASFLVCCSNLLLFTIILICDKIMIFPSPETFEQLKELLHIGACVLIMDIVIQACILNSIQRGSLMTNQIASWIRKLDELDWEAGLLLSNLELFQKLKGSRNSNS